MLMPKAFEALEKKKKLCQICDQGSEPQVPPYNNWQRYSSRPTSPRLMIFFSRPLTAVEPG
jgi:hypothetical protein